MEHVDPRERERIKREMGAFLDTIAEKPYVGLRKMREHRWGGLRLWPKWNAMRKIWKDEGGEEMLEEEETEKRARSMLEEEMAKKRSKKEIRKEKEKVRRRNEEE